FDAPYGAGSVAALEVDDVFLVLPDRLPQADRARLAQVDLVPVQAQLVVVAELDVDTVGGAVRDLEVAAFELDQRMVAADPLGLDLQAVAGVPPQGIRLGLLVELDH